MKIKNLSKAKQFGARNINLALISHAVLEKTSENGG